MFAKTKPPDLLDAEAITILSHPFFPNVILDDNIFHGHAVRVVDGPFYKVKITAFEQGISNDSQC